MNIALLLLFICLIHFKIIALFIISSILLALTMLPPYPLPGLLDFILEDLRGRFELAMAWLYSKYSGNNALGASSQSREGKHYYNVCLLGLLEGARANLPPKDRLFTKLVLEVPHVTPEALAVVISYCNDEVCMCVRMSMYVIRRT